MSPEPRVLILGGGPAGLAAGYYAARRGITPLVLEAAAEPGGNARTLRRGEFLYDTGAHRFHDADADITQDARELLGDELRLTERPSQIVYGTRRIDFPLSPLNLAVNLGPATLARAGFDFIRERLHPPPPEPTFAELSVHRYGRTLAEAFLLGYSAKLWGRDAERLSSAVSGKRLRGLDLRTFLLEAVRGGRAKTRHLDGRFYYPRRGIGQLSAALAAGCGLEAIRTNARVTALRHDGTRIREIEINGGKRLTAGRVISTLPLGLLPTLLDPAPPEAVLTAARGLRFRDIVLVALFLHCERISDNASFYFPDADVPFTRAYEPKNRSAAMAPAGKTSLIVEIPCATDDDAVTADPEALARDTIAALETKRLLRAVDVFDSALHRIRFAYPVLETGYEEMVRVLSEYFRRFENLQIAGRSGRFAYTHIHDLMREARAVAAALE